MTTLLQDIKYGARMMARTPVVTFVAVMSLALGIAANASTFSIVNSFLFEPLPYEAPEELVLFRSIRPGEDIELAGGVSAPNFHDLVEGVEGIESATLYTTERANVTGLEAPEQLTIVVATPSVFDVFGVSPALGRGFRPEEGVEGAGRVIVLEHDYWQARFLGDRDILGRTLTLDGVAHTVVGVMGESFDMIPANVQAFRPSDFRTGEEDRATRGFISFARLAGGVTLDRFQGEVEAESARLSSEFPEANRGIEIFVQPLREFFPGPTDTQLLKILTAVTLFGLLIACANIANLLLGRAEERQKEVAVRTAMGAGRGRIVRQMLTESVLMATTAGAVGTALAVWVVGWLQGAMPAELPAALMPELHPVVLGATLLVTVAAGIAFGLAPAMHSVGGNLRESLGNGARGGTASRSRKRLRNAFVIGEIAVALALLAGSGFLIEAFDRLANDDPGFDASGLLTFQLSVLGDGYPEDSDVVAYERELLRALRDIPAVEDVAIMSSLPRGRANSRTAFTVAGRPEPEPNDRPTAGLQVVNPAYFGTLDIELRRGRLIEDTDRDDGAPVAVVSEGLVARDFPDEDPIGRQIIVSDEPRTIVGVVEDVVLDRMALLGRAGEQIYLPIEQLPLRNPSFAVRSSDEDPTRLAGDVRSAIWSVEADQPIAEVQTLEAFIEESLAGPNAISTFLIVMGAIALTLAAIGIYGVMAHAVTQQQREIGIRLALGATRRTVVGMIARSGLLLVAIGVVAGIPLTWLMYRVTMTGLNLFETDVGYLYPIALAGALLTVAVGATVLPARRASGVAPVTALKE